MALHFPLVSHSVHRIVTHVRQQDFRIRLCYSPAQNQKMISFFPLSRYSRQRRLHPCDKNEAKSKDKTEEIDPECSQCHAHSTSAFWRRKTANHLCRDCHARIYTTSLRSCLKTRAASPTTAAHHRNVHFALPCDEIITADFNIPRESEARRA